MKKVILGMGVIALLASCGGGSAEDVNVAEMKNGCDCAGGLMIIANDILDEVGDMTEDEMEADEAKMKVMEPKLKKLDELEDKCRKELGVKMDEMLECEAELEGVMKKFEEKF